MVEDRLYDGRLDASSRSFGALSGILAQQRQFFMLQNHSLLGPDSR